MKKLCVELYSLDSEVVLTALDYVASRVMHIAGDRPLDESDGPRSNAREIVVAGNSVGSWWVEDLTTRKEIPAL